MAADGIPSFFEGTEKRIEIDFSGDSDLRKVALSGWEEVIKLSATQILNRKETSEFTSFLLSESSLLVYPSKLVLKTCGTTTPMASLPKMLSLAEGVGMQPEWACYSRKNFLSPSEQPEEHKSMENETEHCRKACDGKGESFVLGPMTGEHWFIYDVPFQWTDCSLRNDFHVDIMMYGLPSDVQQVFHTSEPEGSRKGAEAMTKDSGLGALAASIGGEVDDYCFDKCGYSCNIHAGDAYAMVHVTPQDSCSYASFETNVGRDKVAGQGADVGKSVDALVGKVLDSFKPERFTVTLFTDKGACAALGMAPFSAAQKRYTQKSFTSTQFEQDYQAVIANFVKDSVEKRPLDGAEGERAAKARR